MWSPSAKASLAGPASEQVPPPLPPSSRPSCCSSTPPLSTHTESHSESERQRSLSILPAHPPQRFHPPQSIHQNGVYHRTPDTVTLPPIQHDLQHRCSSGCHSGQPIWCAYSLLALVPLQVLQEKPDGAGQ